MYLKYIDKLFFDRRSFFLWQPTINGSRCQLALCHWLPLVLQTDDQCRFWLYHFRLCLQPTRPPTQPPTVHPFAVRYIFQWMKYEVSSLARSLACCSTYLSLRKEGWMDTMRVLTTPKNRQAGRRRVEMGTTRKALYAKAASHRLACLPPASAQQAHHYPSASFFDPILTVLPSSATFALGRLVQDGVQRWAEVRARGNKSCVSD